MKTLAITPAYSHCHPDVERAIRDAGITWLPLYGFSDLVRVRGLLLSRALEVGAERIILVDADTIPDPGVLATMATSASVTPTRSLFGLYPLRDGSRWSVAPEDDSRASAAMTARVPFRIRHAGLGLAALHPESLKRAGAGLPSVDEGPQRWTPFCLPFCRGDDYFPEDRALCARLLETGTELWCDPTLRAGHAVNTVIRDLNTRA